jgi:hypothetical protein
VSTAAPQTTNTVGNLTPGNAYFFAVTAKNAAGLESAYSAEVSYTVPLVPTKTVTIVIEHSTNLLQWVDVLSTTQQIQGNANFWRAKLQ